MPRPRKPRELADVTGYSTKHPERFRKTPRVSVTDQPVGEPHDWLKPEAQEAWRELADNLPWLNTRTAPSLVLPRTSPAGCR